MHDIRLDASIEAKQPEGQSEAFAQSRGPASGLQRMEVDAAHFQLGAFRRLVDFACNMNFETASDGRLRDR
jgi:hypothetical protein